MKNYQIILAFLTLIIISCNSDNSDKEEKKDASQEKTLLDFINEAPNAKDFFSLVNDSSNLISLKELRHF
jgi:hypothetical protein